MLFFTGGNQLWVVKSYLLEKNYSFLSAVIDWMPFSHSIRACFFVFIFTGVLECHVSALSYLTLLTYRAYALMTNLGASLVNFNATLV